MHSRKNHIMWLHACTIQIMEKDKSPLTYARNGEAWSKNSDNVLTRCFIPSKRETIIIYMNAAENN